MRLQFVSDLHLESRPKETFEIMIETGVAPGLALLGDIAPLDHPNLRPFLEWCSENWDTVFYVPGMTELLVEDNPDITVERLRGICETYENIHVLYRDTFFTEDGVVILGCTFWGCLANQPKALRDLHRRDLDWVKAMTKKYANPFCILSHYGPVAWVQDEGRLWHQSEVPTVPEIELLLRKPIVAWVFGHHHGIVEAHKLWNTSTGETREIVLLCNGLGAADSRGHRIAFTLGFRRDAILRLDPAVYFSDTI